MTGFAYNILELAKGIYLGQESGQICRDGDSYVPEDPKGIVLDLSLDKICLGFEVEGVSSCFQ